MGVFYKGLYLPALNEVGWDDEVNANFTILADAHITARSLFLDAMDGLDHTNNRCGTLGTFPDSVPVFSFADGSTYGAYWSFRMPVDSAGGTLLVRPVWAPLASSAGAAVQWRTTLKTVVGATVTGGGTQISWTGQGGAKTISVPVLEPGQVSTGFTPAAGSLVRFAIARLGADAADTLATNALLLGVQLDYTAL